MSLGEYRIIRILKLSRLQGFCKLFVKSRMFLEGSTWAENWRGLFSGGYKKPTLKFFYLYAWQSEKHESVELSV